MEVNYICCALLFIFRQNVRKKSSNSTTLHKVYGKHKSLH